MTGPDRNGSSNRERDIAWKGGWRRLTRLWRSEAANNVDDELRFHFEQKVSEFVEGGMSEADAKRRAEAEFGDVARVRDSLREIDERVASRRSRAEWWDSTAQDMRYVLRTLVRAPLFAATVVITLALGLGANGAIFSVLDRLYLQPPVGVGEPDKATRLYQSFTQRGGVMTRKSFAFAEVRAIRAAAPEGVTVAAYSRGKTRLGRDGGAPEVRATYVEGDYFRVAETRPVIGRFFQPDEYRVEGTSMVAVISHDFWKRALASDPDIIGKSIDLGAHRHTVVGVAAQGFAGFDFDVTDVWVPLNTTGNLQIRKPDWFESRNTMSNSIIARIRDEPTAQLFEVRAADALRSNGIITDTTARTFRGSLTGTLDSQGKSGELSISTRLAGVALVILLIACANVINLMLSRANERTKEIALRLALGVSRRRLVLQLMMESVLLAVMAGGVALLVASAGGSVLRRLLLPEVVWGTSVLNVRLIVMTLCVAVVTGVLIGLIPALQFSRPNLSAALKATRGASGGKHWLRSGALVAQTSLSIVLLAAAGVFADSLRKVETIDVGFSVDRLHFASIEYDREIENHSAEVLAQLPVLAERVGRIPGVESVALSSMTPMYGISFASLFLPDRDSLPPSNGAERTMSAVGPGYFRTAGVRVNRGREFTDADREGSEPVIAISESLARNLWPGEDAFTKCLITSERTNPCRRVVAVVANTHFNEVIEDESMQFYLPLAQAAPNHRPTFVVIRSSTPDNIPLKIQIEKEIRSQFGTWATPRVRTMTEILERQMRPWKLGAALFGAASFLALVVAGVGVYSSIAYTMAQRTREMGVRVALGARMDQIIRLVVGEGLRIVAIGVTIGIMATVALGSFVASMLYETSPRDPYVMIVAAGTLLATALIACVLPAWRASRVDPLTALRAE